MSEAKLIAPDLTSQNTIALGSFKEVLYVNYIQLKTFQILQCLGCKNSRKNIFSNAYFKEKHCSFSLLQTLQKLFQEMQSRTNIKINPSPRSC